MSLRRIADSTEHIFGPIGVHLSERDVILLCLVRNGGIYIRPFVEHHLRLGVKHIVFLDNGSTDNTLSLARGYDRVTILRSRLSFERYNILMRRYLVERFGKGRWSLSVDIDTLFDYPFSDALPLPLLIEYLTRNSYTAVVTQLLDMFSEGPLRDIRRDGKGSIQEACPYYDISEVRKEDYQPCHRRFLRFLKENYRKYTFLRNAYRKSYGTAWNRTSNPRIKFYFGGIRKAAFGMENVWLTNHPLVFQRGRVKPLITTHICGSAHVADLSGVLYHYKFFGDFYRRTVEAVQEENYAFKSYEYKRYHAMLKENPGLSLKRPTARRLRNVNDLLRQDFLVVSPNYTRWVQSKGEGALMTSVSKRFYPDDGV